MKRRATDLSDGLPCRASRRLDDIDCILERCEWILENGELCWKTSYINGRVRLMLCMCG